jgi:hypothetical protein
MDSAILNAMISRGGWARSELICRAPEYIDNDMFINMLNSIDINEMNPAVLRRTCAQFAAFNGVPGLLVKVKQWLNS